MWNFCRWGFVVISMKLMMQLFIDCDKHFYSKQILLIAHPDDESMFFSPFLKHNYPFIVCLSCKDTEREHELRKLCRNEDLEVVFGNFMDGKDWNENEIVLFVLKQLKNKMRNEWKGFRVALTTFDNGGVSGHKNHISCYKAAKNIQTEISRHKMGHLMQFNYLKTLNLFEKYVFCFKRPHFTCKTCLDGYKNMKYHKSQLLWFRYFWIILSNYMLYNIFE